MSTIVQLNFIPLVPGSFVSMLIFTTTLANGSVVKLYELGGNVSIYKLDIEPPIVYSNIGVSIQYTRKCKGTKLLPLPTYTEPNGVGGIKYVIHFTLSKANIQNMAFLNITFQV